MVGSVEALPLVLTVDLEDWHQLVHRAAGVDDRRRNGAFVRQADVLFGVLEALGAHATVFVLGMTAAKYPEIVERAAAAGHEIACHGYAHRRVYTQEREEFRRDVDRSVALIVEICGVRPLGYRAPIFSLNRDSLWAYDVLVEEGFQYDSSQCNCPWVPRSLQPTERRPHVLDRKDGRELWEFPIASIRCWTQTAPIGGGSYWRWIPEPTLLRALGQSGGRYAALYVHPYDFDPRPLRADLTCSASTQRMRARARSAWHNCRRHVIVERLRAVAEQSRLVSCAEALASGELGAEMAPRRGKAVSRPVPA